MKTIEEKELLLKDLSARLPYNLKVCYKEHEYGTESIWNVDYIIPEDFVIVTKLPYGRLSIKDIKPYLRPMSSMTEGERQEYNKFNDFGSANLRRYEYKDFILYIPSFERVDWLNAHHFDYRGLIEKGLALDCTNLNIY